MKRIIEGNPIGIGKVVVNDQEIHFSTFGDLYRLRGIRNQENVVRVFFCKRKPEQFTDILVILYYKNSFSITLLFEERGFLIFRHGTPPLCRDYLTFSMENISHSEPDLKSYPHSSRPH